MAKRFHEIRDPIHNFIHLDRGERALIESEPFQRLRHIHQLSMSHYIYPGATHTRFEHSLGVMEVASRIYGVVTQRHHAKKVANDLSELDDESEVAYWRRNLRMAALCHDIGHFPFSHASEGLLPDDFGNHEAMTRELILSDEMKPIWGKMKQPVRPEEIAELAVELDTDDVSSPWRQLLREIIVSPTFGADRIDYLLRDSHHAGVAYGRFDHHRLIDTLRILPAPPAEPDGKEGVAIQLGIEDGGLHAAEGLLLARYFMFSQVYYHPGRRIYDIHLADFLKSAYRQLPTTVAEHLALTDVEVLGEMRVAAKDPSHQAHEPARRILERQHFRKLYTPNPEHRSIAGAIERVYEAAAAKFGEASVRRDDNAKGTGSVDFPVLKNDIPHSSTSVSEVLSEIPKARAECVYVAPEQLDDAKKWLEQNLDNILS